LKKIKNKEASLYAGLLYLSGFLANTSNTPLFIIKTMREDKQ